MGILSDKEIRRRCLDVRADQAMIAPFERGIKRPGRISFGLSSYGYDIRVAREYKVFSPVSSGELTCVDPKSPVSGQLVPHEGDFCIIPPNSFALAKSVEYIKVPRDLLVLCIGKSTYARCGIHLCITPLEPEWEGQITLEISNTTPLPAKIYSNEGIGQLVFLQAAAFPIQETDGGSQLDLELDLCETSYQDKKGKYQRQMGIVTAKVDGLLL